MMGNRSTGQPEADRYLGLLLNSAFMGASSISVKANGLVFSNALIDRTDLA
jgi:hypothetical protein